MRSLGFVLALLVLACNSSPTDPTRPLDIRDESVTLPFGDARRVNDDLVISFAELVEDSRCPTSVVCVWEGNGKIRLDVTTRRGSRSITLNTHGGTEFPRDANAFGYRFTLVELQPERVTPDPVPAQQYRARLRVTASSDVRP